MSLLREELDAGGKLEIKSLGALLSAKLVTQGRAMRTVCSVRTTIREILFDLEAQLERRKNWGAQSGLFEECAEEKRSTSSF